MPDTSPTPGSPRGPVNGYRGLVVWQRAMELVVQIYPIAHALPASERYGLIQQLTRAAVSVPANIAEGQGRLTRADFDRHLAIARDSLKEVETLLQVAERLKMLPPERITHALSLADEIGRMLSTLITRLAKPRKR